MGGPRRGRPLVSAPGADSSTTKDQATRARSRGSPDSVNPILSPEFAPCVAGVRHAGRWRSTIVLLACLLALQGALPTAAQPRLRPAAQISVPWWNPSWQYARQLDVLVGLNAPFNGYAGYTARLVLDTTDATRFRGDCFDVRLVYWDGGANVELDRGLYGCATAATEVWFPLQTDLPAGGSDSDYYLYYGNPLAGAAPADLDQVYLWWDDFSTNPFGASPRYSRTKAVDIHGDTYVAPTYDAANQRVTFDTGDNFTSDLYINAPGFSNGEQDVLIQVDHFADLSYPTNATDALVARVNTLGTTSSHEYIHFSHGSYSPSPGCTIDSWSNGERNTLCGGIVPAAHWPFSTAETWAWGVFDTAHRFWRGPGTTYASPDPSGRTLLLSGALSPAQSGYIGLAPAQSRGWWDNLLVRRYTEPEPSVSLGTEYAYADPVISDPKIDSLFADNDSSGAPSPGDVLAYSVLISNTGGSAATGVVFTDTPDPNTSLVVGSVAATAGTISSGNTPGDTSVAVSIGLLSPGDSVTITFRVLIDDPIAPGVDQVANQGTTTGSNIPPTPTDDPATSNPADPTVTALGRLAPVLPATGFAPGRITLAPEEPPQARLTDLGGLWLEIPGLALRAEIVGVPLQPQGWDVGWLRDQVGYLEGTAFPTWPGNTVLTGHVYLPDGAPGPFAGLGELTWDDTIYIDTAVLRYVYAVRSFRRVGPTDLSALDHETLDWLTLLTCAEYDQAAGGYRRRLVVQAVLVATDLRPTDSAVP